jgi:hypothetical protein
MFESLLLSQLVGNIMAWCLSVQQYRACVKDSVETLKDLTCQTDHGTKPVNVGLQMCKNVKLDLRDRLGGINECETIKYVTCCNINIILQARNGC